MYKLTTDTIILNHILEIEKNKNSLDAFEIPQELSDKFIKNSMKISSYASNKIEGNPLSYMEAENIIDNNKRHLSKSEQEIRNYYLALEFLNLKLKEKSPVDMDLLLNVQRIICDGMSEEKIGIRGKMPPGVLFAVWNSDRTPAYIPPEETDIRPLLNELFEYLSSSNEHPLIKAAILHYQIVTIHPFEDGNGRTARIISNYYLSLNGYGFKNVGSLDEYISMNIQEYYDSIQMGLPVLYYSGRNNPPHMEIWVKYFLKIMEKYSSKMLEVALDEMKQFKK